MMFRNVPICNPGGYPPTSAHVPWRFGTVPARTASVLGRETRKGVARG